jgi:hypothetical protein
VHGRVDVRPGVIAHGDRQRRGREFVAVGIADLLVRAEGRDDDGRMRQEARHLVIDLKTEVDEPHGSSKSLADKVSLTVPRRRVRPILQDGLLVAVQ